MSKECPVVDIGRMTNNPKAGSLGEGGEGLGQGREGGKVKGEQGKESNNSHMLHMVST